MAKEKPQYAWSKPERTPDQIEADLAKTRERLTGTLNQLEVRLEPSSLSAKGKTAVRGFYVTEDGKPRWDKVAITVGAVGATILGIRIASVSVRWLFGAQRPVKVPSGVVYVPVAANSVGSVGELQAA